MDAEIHEMQFHEFHTKDFDINKSWYDFDEQTIA